MTNKTKQKRPAPISYRPPADLAEEFQRRVEASGLSVNAREIDPMSWTSHRVTEYWAT